MVPCSAAKQTMFPCDPARNFWLWLQQKQKLTLEGEYLPSRKIRFHAPALGRRSFTAVPISSQKYEEEKKVIKVIIIASAQIQEMGKTLIDLKAFFCLL